MTDIDELITIQQSMTRLGKRQFRIRRQFSAFAVEELFNTPVELGYCSNHDDAMRMLYNNSRIFAAGKHKTIMHYEERWGDVARFNTRALAEEFIYACGEFANRKDRVIARLRVAFRALKYVTIRIPPFSGP